MELLKLLFSRQSEANILTFKDFEKNSQGMTLVPGAGSRMRKKFHFFLEKAHPYGITEVTFFPSVRSQ